MKAGIVIVAYNSASCLEQCLAGALRACKDVVVVDNASEDESRAVAGRFPSVKLIANPVNRGFAAAVNQGVEALDAAYVLVLNPDARFECGWERLLEACSRPGVGAAAGLLLDSGGRVQSGFSVRRFPTPGALIFEVLGLNRLWPSNPVNRRYRCLDLDLSKPQEVEQPAGAFLMFRREAWLQAGGFDERFCPIWFEDVDFLKRIRDLGWSIFLEPEARATHQGGHSIHPLPPGKRLRFWYASLLMYAARHFPPWRRRLLCAAVLAGVTMRMGAATVIGRSLRVTGDYASVLRLASRELFSGCNTRASSSPLVARGAKALQKGS